MSVVQIFYIAMRLKRELDTSFSQTSFATDCVVIRMGIQRQLERVKLRTTAACSSVSFTERMKAFAR